MKKIKLFSLVAAALFAGSTMAQTVTTGTYSKRTINGEGNTSTWDFTGINTTGSNTNVAEGADEDIYYKPSQLGKIKLYSNGTGLSCTATSSIYLPVPSGSAGTVTMTCFSSSSGRQFDLYVGDTKSDKNLPSSTKTNSSFSFVSTDITTFGGKTYLLLKDNNAEMKVSSFSIALTTGSYGAGTTDPDAPTLESIAIDGELTNTEYSEGETIDYAGLSVNGTFSDGSTGTVERGIVWSIAPELAVGTTDYTVTATVGELKATKDVKLTVTAVVLESLAFKGSLNLASCYVGEPLGLAGLTVEAVYSNGTKKDVTEEASITTDAIIESGTVTITASYGELIATTEAYIYVCKRPSTTGTVLLSYEHAETTPKGIELGELSIGSANIHTNKDKANGIKLDGSYVKDNAYVPGKVVSLSVEGGFKASDEIVVAAFFNKNETKQAQVDIFTLNADNTTNTLHTIGQAVNGYLVDNDPFEAVYTLTEDADTIRLGRKGNTNTYIYTIKVIRPKSDIGSAVEEAEVGAQAVKVMRDGQLLIIRDGKTYTAQGVELR